MSVSTGILVMKRMKCINGERGGAKSECSVFKAGLCLDLRKKKEQYFSECDCLFDKQAAKKRAIAKEVKVKAQEKNAKAALERDKKKREKRKQKREERKQKKKHKERKQKKKHKERKQKQKRQA